MTDGFSASSDKETNKITEDTGKSPLERSIGNGSSEGMPAKPTNSLEPQIQKPPMADFPKQNESKPTPMTDLPSGVNTQPAPEQTTQMYKEPAEQTVLSQDPNVLKERQEAPVATSETTSKDPAILDALKNTDKQDIAPVETERQENQVPAGRDLGEPSKAPDTDEFLKSILKDEPEVPTANSPVMGGEPPSGMPDQHQTIPPDDINPRSENMQQNLNEQTFQSQMPQSEEIQPESVKTEQVAAPISQKSPIDDQNGFDDRNKPTGGVGIDSISGAEPPVDDSDSMINAAQNKPKNSPLKIILAILLAVIIVAGGYYVYTVLFPSEQSYNANSTQLSKDIDYTTGLETDTFANDDEQRKSDLATIKEALLNYYAGEGKFPKSENLTLLTQGNILEVELVPTHLTSIPNDPGGIESYGYKSDGASFTLTAVLDDSSDPDIVLKDGKAIYSLIYDASSAVPAATSTSEQSTDEPMPTQE